MAGNIMQVINTIVPTLVDTMRSENAATRAGVCYALKEILESMTRDQLPAVMPAVQAALCDEDAQVRLVTLFMIFA
jgi:hypothetical protein